jgi:hypothetical protein
MFTSDRDGEVVMAARSFVRVFSGAGSSIFALADAVEGSKGKKGEERVFYKHGGRS